MAVSHGSFSCVTAPLEKTKTTTNYKLQTTSHKHITKPGSYGFCNVVATFRVAKECVEQSTSEKA